MIYLAYHGVGFNGVSPVVPQAIAQVVVVIQQPVQNFEQVLRGNIEAEQKTFEKNACRHRVSLLLSVKGRGIEGTMFSGTYANPGQTW